MLCVSECNLVEVTIVCGGVECPRVDLYFIRPIVLEYSLA